jgi:murein DD-endopeptidase MepM/ murein hydrolase activator NlpD
MSRQGGVGGRSQRWATAVAVVSVGAALLATPALGDPASDKRRVDQQLSQAAAALEHATARAQQAGIAYNQANQLIPKAEQAVARAQGEVAAAQVQAATAAKLAARAKAALAISEAQLAASERQVEAARDHLSSFVRASYQGAPYVTASAMLGARTPDQLIAGMGYLNNLAGGERRAVTQVTKDRLVASQRRATVAEYKRIADSLEGQAQAALGVAHGQEAVAAAAQQRVVELVTQRKQSMKVAEEEKAANKKQYAEVQAESRRIAAALREAARQARAEAARKAREAGRKPTGGKKPPATRPGTSQPGRPSAAGLSKPVNGYKSSDFGMRYDPYYNVWQLHAGTDFAAPGGAPIWAADDGVVVRAGWNGGYGNYTCIYHGDLKNGRGLSTCYAHQSRILVSRGQHVSRGQTIGRVGTTGASTGNHLHFEVRIDGEPVNPLRWL